MAGGHRDTAYKRAVGSSLVESLKLVPDMKLTLSSGLKLLQAKGTPTFITFLAGTDCASVT
jgi:hypothetical protein